MAKKSKVTATILLIVACVAVFGAMKYFKAKAASQIQRVGLPQRAMGNPEAAVKIVEFIDFQCPACANGVKILHEYFDKYPGKMYLELRYFPLAMHQHGLLSARWGECAARQEKFWPFFDLLIDRQKEWSVMSDAVPSFSAIAKAVGLNQDRIDACLADSSVDEVIKKDVEEGQLRQISSTPTYLINHEMIVGTKSLKSKLDEALGLKSKEPVTETGKKI